jgi:N-acetylmuramic acid 6-phosphate etherase
MISAMTLQSENPGRSFLGIEGGGTRTIAVLADGAGHTLDRLETGPSNMKLLTDGQLIRHFRSLAKALACPDALGIGLSGAWVEADFQRIRSAAAKVWPSVPCYATNDLETALTAACRSGAERRDAQVLIVSGTGSCAYGKTAKGEALKVGGWGHVLGDEGSGYDIGLQALRAVVAEYDQGRAWPELGRRILRALVLNEPNDLIDWAQSASKAQIANLALEVFAASQCRDKVARLILARAARSLARDGAACARRVAKPGTAVQFVLSGSILLKQPRFAAQVGREVRKLRPAAVVTSLERESVWGAVELARRAARAEAHHPQPPVRSPQSAVPPSSVAAWRRVDGPQPERGRGATDSRAVVHSTRPSPTEQRNPRSMDLDKLGVRQAIELMLREDAQIPKKLLAEAPRIEQVVQAVARAFRRGGRLFYAGAGTSGRLGVLDASECPPTFGTSPELVQGLIAGGQPALWSSVEGAEDDAAAGARALEQRGIGARDIVIGIAASGTTPFVWGALEAAKQRGATTVLVCFNPFLSIPRHLRPAILISPNLGPEILTGSTRLKAGTATKLLLNLFTTLAMVRVGKVRSNLMIDLNPANTKLRDRAVRIVQDLTGVAYAPAERALQGSGWVIKKALARLTGKNLLQLRKLAHQVPPGDEPQQPGDQYQQH